MATLLPRHLIRPPTCPNQCFPLPSLSAQHLHTTNILHPPPSIQTITTSPHMTSRDAKVLSSSPLSSSQSNWVTLRSISWVDPTGKQRKWESADRTTRKGAVDAVAILPLIHSPHRPTSVLLISQFRAPVGKSVIELPAGLVDEGESVETAALRELHEETGYGTEDQGAKVEVIKTSPILFNDPGLTGSNMQLCIVKIQLKEGAKDPVAQPEEGECIEKYLVNAQRLYEELMDFESKGYAVDARLAHLAAGLQLGLGTLTNSNANL